MKVKVKQNIEIVSLKKYLEGLTKEELDKLYKKVFSDEDILDYKKISHKKEIEELYEDMIAEYVGYFSTIEEEDKNKFQVLITDKVMEEEDEKLLEVRVVIKENDCYLLFEEAIEKYEMFSNITDEELIYVKKQIALISYLEINGLLEKVKLKELMEASGYKITDEEITQYLEELKDRGMFEENNIIYFHELAKNVNEDGKYLIVKNLNEYKILEEEDFMAITLLSPLFLIYDNLVKIIKKKTRKEDIAEIAYLLKISVSAFGECDDLVREFFELKNINLTKAQESQIIAMLKALSNFIPSWELNGYALSDLEEDNNFENLSDEEKVEYYIEAYVDINGIIKIETLLEILKQHHNLKVSKKDLIKVAKQDFEIIKDYICMTNFDDEVIETLDIIKQKRNDMYIIEDACEVIDEFEEDNYFLDNILEEYNLTEEIVSIFNALIQNGVFMEDAIPFVLEEHNISMPLKKQRRLYEELRMSANNRRLWYLNGFKPSEINTVVKKDKIGRNDLCSCGSGKKYKKCCGK